MRCDQVKKIVIVGGGTAGWMTGAFLSKFFGNIYDITLIESDQIGTIGVGEATIPPFLQFNRRIGLDLNELLKKTSGTIKLGIDFRGWGKKDSQYFHYFGDIGVPVGALNFHAYWLYAKQMMPDIELDDYIFHAHAVRGDKFNLTRKNARNQTVEVPHAYHIDATRYAQLLRSHAESMGLKRQEGKIVEVIQDSESGNIDRVKLESGLEVAGDLFIDCSGTRALLIEDTLKTGFTDWGDYLFNDRAIAVQTETVSDPVPYTVSQAHSVGWQWRIPLQHRMGNGYVYSSRYLDDDKARTILESNLEGKMVTDPRLIKFKTGHANKLWNKNVVSIGLSGGFLEPLESTSIHLIHIGIKDLGQALGSHADMDVIAKEYNRTMLDLFVYIRDFIVLHYVLNERDEPYWKDCAAVDLPETLKHRIELFKNNGAVNQCQEDLFGAPSWVQVMMGQGVMPKGYQLLASTQMTDDKLKTLLTNMKNTFAREAEQMLTHKEFLARNCPFSG